VIEYQDDGEKIEQDDGEKIEEVCSKSALPALRLALILGDLLV
jgi:hypothetical protein